MSSEINANDASDVEKGDEDISPDGEIEEKNDAKVCEPTSSSKDVSDGSTRKETVEKDDSHTTYYGGIAFEDLVELLKRDIKDAYEQKWEYSREEEVTLPHCYEMACEKYKIFPLSKSVRTIESEVLNLTNLHMSKTAIKPLIETLFFSDNIKELIFPGNRLGAEGLEIVAQLFAAKGSITRLNCSNNMLGTNSCKPISKIISYGYRLRHLDLSKNELDDAEIMKILPALEDNVTLKELNMSDNKLKSGSGKPFGQFLASHNDVLEKLDLSYNKLRGGAAAIFLSLRENKTLKVLLFRQNELGEECAAELGKGLEGNNTLEDLDLGYNSFTKECMVEISKGIKCNTSLKKLDLEQNPVRAQGALALISAVASPENVMEYLNLSGVRVNVAFLKTLHEIKSSDRKFTVVFGAKTSTRPCSKLDNTIFREISPMQKVMNIADQMGLNLVKVLQKMHMNFLERKHQEEEQHKPVENPDSNVDSEAVADDIKEEERFPRIKSEDFVEELMNCELNVPEDIAVELTQSFEDTNLSVDISEVIVAIPLRSGHFELEIETPKEAPDQGKDKGKDKKKK